MRPKISKMKNINLFSKKFEKILPVGDIPTTKAPTPIPSPVESSTSHPLSGPVLPELILPCLHVETLLMHYPMMLRTGEGRGTAPVHHAIHTSCIMGWGTDKYDWKRYLLTKKIFFATRMWKKCEPYCPLTWHSSFMCQKGNLRQENRFVLTKEVYWLLSYHKSVFGFTGHGNK